MEHSKKQTKIAEQAGLIAANAPPKSGEPEKPDQDLQTELAEIKKAYKQLLYRKENQTTLQFLVKAGEILASSLDYQTTLQNLAQLTVPTLTDWCTVHIVDATGFPAQVALAHIDPSKVEWAREIQQELNRRWPYDPDAEAGIPKVLRTGEPEIIPEIPDEMLVAAAPDERVLEILREVEYNSVIVVPLIARGRVIGAMQFVTTKESGYHYSERDLALALEIARRAAMAVDNARLYYEAQQALVAQQELDQLRDRFLSIASHELRTPLTSIKGFSQMLQIAVGKRTKLIEENPQVEYETLKSWLERDAKMLESMQHQINRMNELIGEMLDISRIQSGHLKLEFTPNLDILEIIKRVVEQQQTVSPHHTIIIEDGGMGSQTKWEQVRFKGEWDERRIEQVLSNLINNAVKYSPQNTTVRVGLDYRPSQAKRNSLFYHEKEVPKIETSPVSQDDYITIWVKDEGFGISPEDQANIFQRFYRAHNELGSHLDGLGLGLYISKQIILQHGGQMWVESKLNKGSTFYFSLPLKSSITE